MTHHKIYFNAAQEMTDLSDQSIDLIVTSPPYPMIEMWDEIMCKQNNSIEKAFKNKDYQSAFELMHKELDAVWAECFRVLKNGGIACINIGDATRTLDQNFALYPNHARIIQNCLQIGFQNLPNIIWRKQTNAPNKFMGSGMLPPGAYVTLEHEFILVFRKGRKREFTVPDLKKNRQHSSYFWEERNMWFSDMWNFLGINQKLFDKNTRERSAAYPLQLPYRLINMFSTQGDLVLDPFIGTGTTTLAAMALNRNSIGFEIDEAFSNTIEKNLLNKEEILSKIIENRLEDHLKFVGERTKMKGKDAFKYLNTFYKFPVMTRQEINIRFPYLNKTTFDGDKFIASYSDNPFINY